MKTTLVNAALTALLIFSLINNGYAAPGADEEFNLTQVGKGIYVHQGKHVHLEHAERDDIANIGFIAGDECIAVVDTGGSISMGRAFREAIKTKFSLPVCYVINTHVHFDHVLGNVAFKADKPTFIGHENLEQEIEQNRPFFLSEFAADLGPNPGHDSIIGPDVTVSDELELDLGNRAITLTAHPPSHSYSDLSIHDKKTGTLWLSDLLFIERIPVLDGSLKGWLKTMEKLKAQNANHVIPGHGTITMSWPEAVYPQEKYLETLLTETRREISQGTFMEEAVDIIGKEEKKGWLLYEQSHKRNVTKAYTELEWE